MRHTYTAHLIADALLAEPQRQHWGLDLMRRTGLESGALYPVLHRMLAAGWLADEREKPRPEARPPRRYYRITPEGRAALNDYVGKAKRA